MNSEHDSVTLTDLIRMAGNDCSGAKDELYRRVYRELRAMSRRHLWSYPDCDLQTTDIVHELVIRFENGEALKSFANRKVFFAVASRAMCQILVDHYRRTKVQPNRTPLHDDLFDQVVERIQSVMGCDMEDLHEALESLKLAAPRQHEVIMLRFFSGLTIAEVASTIGVSCQAIERDWRLARAFLFRALKE